MLHETRLRARNSLDCRSLPSSERQTEGNIFGNDLFVRVEAVDEDKTVTGKI